MKARWLLLATSLAVLVIAVPAQARHAPFAATPHTPLTRDANTWSPALVRLARLAQHSPAAVARGLANTNPATFTDPANDAGSAPDVLNVIVSNDAAGTFKFRINVTKLTLPSDTIVFLLMDTDQNPATGTSGVDYVLVCDESNGSVGLLRWDGSQLVVASSPTLTASDDGTGITATLNRSDIGGSSGFNFGILTVEGPSPIAGHVDDAPDQNWWNYQLTAAGPLKLNVTLFGAPKTVKAGKRFIVTMVAVRSDNSASVNEEIGGSVACQAAVAGKRLAALASGFVEGTDPELAACAWRAPKNARKKTIRGSITVSVEGVNVKKTFALKVK